MIGGAAIVSENGGMLSIILPDGTDLGTGARSQEPYCNSAKIVQLVWQSFVDECEWKTQYTSAVSIYEYSSLNVQVSSDRIRQGGTCLSSHINCSVVYAIVMKLAE